MDKENNFISIIIVVALILIGAFFFFRGEKDSGNIIDTIPEAPDLSGVATHKVLLTKDGYTPNEINIKKGEVIVFSTDQNNLFWPASNIHPSHSIYPEFDPKNPIEPQDSWAFIFDNPGVWKYHDHLNPIYRGVVNVAE